MNKKVRFGIVGVGSRGLGAFGEMIVDRSDAEIVAMCDTNRIRLETGAERLKISPAFYSNIGDMLKQESLDAVVITTPDYLHEQCAVAALEAGVNVLVDKPLAISVKGCKHIIDTAEKSGRIVMIGFNLRHNAVLKRLKQIVSDGMLGRVFLVENREFYNGGRTYMSRWNRRHDFCGGLWIHKGSHDFDVFQWLLDFPKPVKVSSFAGVSVLNKDHLPFPVEPGKTPGPTCHECPYKDICPDVYDISASFDRWGDEAAALDGYRKDLCIYLSDKTVHDNGFAMVEYDNGARASHMECFVTSVTDRRYTIVGELGQAEASLTDRTIIIRPRWSEETITYHIPEEEGGHGGADPKLLDTFIKVITGVLPNTSTTYHGMMSTAVGQAAELSRKENRTVFIEELFQN